MALLCRVQLVVATMVAVAGLIIGSEAPAWAKGAAAADSQGTDRMVAGAPRALPGHGLPMTRQPPRAAGGGVVYLTFDDGPSRYTPQILATLNAYGVTATFFMIGRAASLNPLRARAVIASGSAVGNHTWGHPDLTKLSNSAILTQLHQTRAVLPAGSGGCFRPPYGATNNRVRRVAAQYGYRQMLWNVDPRDWSRPGSKVVFRRVVSKVRNGSIVLLHDGGGNRSGTVAAVRRIVPWLIDHGYQMVSLPSCR